MRVRRVREVTVQTSETIVMRTRKTSPRATCEICAGVEMFSPETAAVTFRVPVRWIYRHVEAGDLHFREFGTGVLLVCSESLRGLIGSSARKFGSIQPNHEER